MKAIILSAGQGKRLLPLTETSPKCLLPLGEGMTLLGWQLSQLALAGIEEAVIVTGFFAEKVEAEAARYLDRLAIRTLHNPFYHVADNLGSVWLAKEEMSEDFIILNGDTVFTASVPERLMREASAPITLTIARKERYDADDMKVTLEGNRLVAVSKTLTKADGESIGMMRFQGEGPARFRRAVELAMRDEASVKRWYLSVIDGLSREMPVGVVEVAQSEWCEVDFPADLEVARQTLAGWKSRAETCPA